MENLPSIPASPRPEIAPEAAPSLPPNNPRLIALLTAMAAMGLVTSGCPGQGTIDDDSTTDDATPTDDDDTPVEPECTNLNMGLIEECPAVNCEQLLSVRPDAESDVYWLDLDGDNDGNYALPPAQLACDMVTFDEAGITRGWTILDVARAPQLLSLFDSIELYPHPNGGSFYGPSRYLDPQCTSFLDWIRDDHLYLQNFVDFRVSADCEHALFNPDGAAQIWKAQGGLFGCEGADNFTWAEVWHTSPGCPDTSCDTPDAPASMPVLGNFDASGNGVGDGYCIAFNPWQM